MFRVLKYTAIAICILIAADVFMSLVSDLWGSPTVAFWGWLFADESPAKILATLVQIVIAVIAGLYAKETWKMRIQDRDALHFQKKQFILSRAPYLTVTSVLIDPESSCKGSRVKETYSVGIKNIGDSGIAKDVLLLFLNREEWAFDWTHECLESGGKWQMSLFSSPDWEELTTCVSNNYGDGALHSLLMLKANGTEDLGYAVAFYRDSAGNPFMTHRIVDRQYLPEGGQFTLHMEQYRLLEDRPEV